MNLPIGTTLRVIVPIDVSEDVHWPIGTVAEIVEVHEDGIGYEVEAGGVVASFAAIDLIGEYRWFNPDPDHQHFRQLLAAGLPLNEIEERLDLADNEIAIDSTGEAAKRAALMTHRRIRL